MGGGGGVGGGGGGGGVVVCLFYLFIYFFNLINFLLEETGRKPTLSLWVSKGVFQIESSWVRNHEPPNEAIR